MRVAVCITGASGSIYAKRLIDYLEDRVELSVVISDDAKKIFKDELSLDFLEFTRSKRLKLYENGDFYSPLASGSHILDSCVVVPCSMKTLSAIAHGFAESLIYRCADVCIKERRKLVVVPRETPLSAIHLENMLKLAQLGVVILPPTPAFYGKPKNISEIVDFVVGRILDSIGIENNLYKRWG